MPSITRRWPPLDAEAQEIRIFELAPSPDLEAPPSGELKVFSIKNLPDYDAISYAWGSAGHVKSVLLNGNIHYVTATLQACLRHLRRGDEPRMLWCDAICVNQSDKFEKSNQIQVMQHIYAGASTVHVWFGLNSATLDRVFDLMNKIHETPSHEDPFEDGRSIEEGAVAEAIEFAAASWWDRLWVIQEAALAQQLTFHHGLKELPYAKLDAFMDRIQGVFWRHDMKQASDEFTEKMQRCWDRINDLFKVRDMGGMEAASQRRLGAPPEFLLEIIGPARTRAVTEPKDRVFGFLALVEKAFGTTLISPNYDLSLAEIYREFAYGYMHEAKSLSLLRQASQPLNDVPSLPSWVPDWTSRYDFEIENNRHTITGMLYCASGDAVSTPHIGRPLPDILELIGMKVDSVQHLGIPQEERVRRVGGVQWSHVRSWMALFQETSGKSWLSEHSPGQTLQQAFWKAMFNDVWFTSGRFAQRVQLKDLSIILEELEQLAAGSQKEEDFWGDMMAHTNMISLATERRRFIVTAAGSPGIAPPDTEAGDEIWIVGGSTLPLVVRRVQDADGDSPPIYTYVGDCYVVGIMYGECLKDGEQRMTQPLWLE